MDPNTQRIGPLNITTGFRKATNIRQLIVKSDLNTLHGRRGSHACAQNCIACPLLNSKTEIRCNSNKNKVFIIKGSFNCTTYSIVYIISCKKCGMQYVGQSRNSIRERLYGHLADIKTKNDVKPISRHFTTHAHIKNDIDVTVVTTTPKDNNIRLRTEETFIEYFKTKTPQGLNLVQ